MDACNNRKKVNNNQRHYVSSQRLLLADFNIFMISGFVASALNVIIWYQFPGFQVTLLNQ